MHIPTSIRSFVAYELPGLVPRGIENRFRSAAEFRIQRLNHRPDVQVFQGDVIVSINIVSAPLVQEVVPPVLHLLVDPGNRDPLLAAVPAALHCPGQLSLSTPQPFCRLPDVVRVLEDHSVGIGGEVLQIQVDPDRPGAGRRFGRVRSLGDDRHKPLVSRRVLDHDLLDPPGYRAAELDRHLSDLAQPEAVPREFEPALLVDHRVKPLLPQLADLPPLCLQSSQGNQVVNDLLNHVLQNLAVDFLQLRVLFFQLRETGIPVYLVLKTPMPDKGAPRKPGEQPLLNGVRGVCSVPGDVSHSRLHESVSAHQAIIYPAWGESVQTRGCNSAPRLKSGACLHPENPGSVNPFCRDIWTSYVTGALQAAYRSPAPWPILFPSCTQHDVPCG